MLRVTDIIKYMTRYWVRYPEELTIDPELHEIIELASKYSVYLESGIFIVYQELEDKIIIMYYCFDFQENLRQTMKAHRKFIKNKVVYIPNFKEVYKRKNIAVFDATIQMWRFI